MKNDFMRIGILSLLMGLLATTNIYADCPRRIRDLSNELGSEKPREAYERRNGTAIGRLLEVLKAMRSIDPESIYIVVVEDFDSPSRDMIRGRELPSIILTAYVKRHNATNKSAYRLGKVWVATQTQGARKIKYYKVTGAPSVLAKILNDLRSIKWAGWEDPRGPKQREVKTLDVNEAGDRMTDVRVTTDLSDLLVRRNSDRIREISMSLSKQGESAAEIYVVVADRLEKLLTKAAQAKEYKNSEFGKFEGAARDARLKVTKADQARSGAIVGYIYKIKGRADEIAKFLQEPAQTAITWAAFELPQFEP